MAGESARPQDETREDQTTTVMQWYAVTGDGDPALRIAPGMTVGEDAAGALTLNDPDPRHQWIAFDLVEGGHPSVAIVTRDKSLLVDGTAQMRRTLRVGETLKLPHNALYISRDGRLPTTRGPVLEVVPREVPSRPQDLVAPGWEQALEAAQAAPAGPADPLATAGLMPDDEDPTEPSPRRPAAMDDFEVTVAEPRRAARAGRGGRRRGSSSTLLYLVGGVLALSLAAAAIITLRPTQTPDEGPAAGPAPAPVASPDVQRPAPAEPPVQEPQQVALGRVPPERPAPQQQPAAAPPAGSGTERGSEPVGSAPTTQARGTDTRSDGSEGASSGAGDAAAADARSPATPAEQAAPPDTVAEAPAAAPAATASSTGQPATGDVEPDAPAPNPAAAAESAGPEPEADAPAPAPDGGATASAQAAVPDWRLVRARELMEEGYITFPPDDNAVAYIERLLADEPGNPRALALLAECTSRLIDAAVRAHDQGLEYEARNTLEEILGFNPGHRQANRLWQEWVEDAR